MSLSSLYACCFSLYNAAIIACNTIPLFDQDIRLPYPTVRKGRLFKLWNRWINRTPEAKDVKLTHGSLKSVAAVIGTNLFKKAPQVILIDEKIENIDPYATMLQCKHEFAHIKQCDSILIRGVLLISTVACAVFGSERSLMALITISATMMLIYQKTIEIRADNYAIAHATKKELQGGVRFFEAAILAKNKPQNNKSHISFVSLDTHPPDFFRQKAIEKQLKNKFFFTQDELLNLKKDHRVQLLCNHLKKKNK